MSYFELSLPHRLASQDWKVKILTEERLEPPHVEIKRRTKSWRYNIRNPGFMDQSPPARDVPEELVAFIHQNLSTLRNEWNDSYPNNPV